MGARPAKWCRRVMERYRSAKRRRRGASSTRYVRRRAGIASMRCAHFGNARRLGSGEVEAPRERKRRYGATIKDAMTALWGASDRVCGKRLKVMIPILLPALEQHGRLQLGQADRDRVLASAPLPSIAARRCEDRGERRQAAPCRILFGIRREVPIRTFI